MALDHIASIYDEISDKYKFGTLRSSDDESSWRVDKVLTKQRHNVGNIFHDMKQHVHMNMQHKYTHTHQKQRDIGMMVMDYEQHYEKNGNYEYTAIHELSDSGILLPRGRVINVEIGGGRDGITKLNADPMPVLEPVSRGDWVVLDVHNDAYGFFGCDFDHKYDVERLSSIHDISSLVEVVSDGVGAFGSVEGGDAAALALNTSASAGGGIGLSCPTQTSLLEMSTLLSTLNKNRKRYEMTDSGIITQQYHQQQQQQQQQRQQENQRQELQTYISSDGIGLENVSAYAGCGGTTYAIVMPFDQELWRTSSFFLLQ